MHARPELSEAVQFDEHGHPVLDSSWAELATPEHCRHAYDQFKAFRKTFIAHLGLSQFASLNSAIWPAAAAELQGDSSAR